MKMLIEIENLTEAQKIALEDMFATMVNLGNIGASRWVCFYSDGDGNFRPKIIVDGKKPEFTKLLTKEDRWKNDEYRIDFDKIAWLLRDIKEKRKLEKNNEKIL
mgnify:FL=1|jgi:hypothetical protein